MNFEGDGDEEIKDGAAHILHIGRIVQSQPCDRSRLRVGHLQEKRERRVSHLRCGCDTARSSSACREGGEVVNEQIEWLRDDIASCRAAMLNATDAAEKSEYRMRLEADMSELRGLLLSQRASEAR